MARFRKQRMAVSGCEFRRPAKYSRLSGSLRLVFLAKMGDQFCLHVPLRLRLGVGRVDSIRLQHGIRGTMVSIPWQTGVGHLGEFHLGPSDYTGGGRRHAGTDFPE